MAKYRTHYDNSKVTRNAPDSVIRAAYKALMQQYHPDKYDGTEVQALRITKIINDAYEILNEPVRRAEHDKWIDEQEQEAQNDNAVFDKTVEIDQQLNDLDYLNYTEHELYGVAAKELTMGKVKHGVMGRAIVEADGNEAKVSARYIQNRVNQLLEEIEGAYLIELTQLGCRVTITHNDFGSKKWNILTKRNEVHLINSLEEFKPIISKFRCNDNQQRADPVRSIYKLGSIGLKEALDKAYADPPDLIVSDILMPVMDGYALCRQWKSDDQLKHIPLVFYTATYTEHRDEVFALKLGADRFVLKPQGPHLTDEYFERGAGRRPFGQASDKQTLWFEPLFDVELI